MPLTREPRNKDIYTDEVDQKGGYTAKVRDTVARKSIEDLQAAVEDLENRPPAVVIDDTTPSYGSVYSSQKVEDELSALDTALSGGIDELEDALDVLILVQDAQPTNPDNRIWIKETATPVVIPDMDDIADFVSFAEDQTSRTDAEKAQARANIGASPEYVVEPHFISGQTMTANAAKVFEIGIDKSGYTPVCVVGVRPEYPMTIAVYFWGIVGGKGMVKIRNVANSAVGSFTLTIDVLYRKNDPS